MDISAKIGWIVRYLLRNPTVDVDAILHLPSNQTLQRYILVISLYESGKPVRKASALGQTKYEAIIKAISEIGESYIRSISGLEFRSGIAGGFLKSLIETRAKSEVIERDAFFYHYRTETPFKGRYLLPLKDSRGRQLLYFEMLSAFKNYHSILVTTPECISGQSDCLMFGTATHLNHEVAIAKAVDEYIAIGIKHELRPKFCQKIYQRPDSIMRLADFHHAASRDERNIEIFKKLCNVTHGPKTRDKGTLIDDPNLWKIQEYKSPLRFFKYIHASHPELINIEFGKPELGYEPPLFHPFW